MNFPTFHNPCSTSLLFPVGISGSFKKGESCVTGAGVKMFICLESRPGASVRLSKTLSNPLPSTSFPNGSNHWSRQSLLLEKMSVECYGRASTWGGRRSYRKVKRETGQVNSWRCTYPMCHITVSAFLLWQFSKLCKYPPYNCLKNTS